jgi:hypothetical protein
MAAQVESIVWETPDAGLPESSPIEADNQPWVPVLFFALQSLYSGWWDTDKQGFLDSYRCYHHPKNVKCWAYAPKGIRPEGVGYGVAQERLELG